MTPITVEGPDGQKYEFPEGTDPTVMKQAMAKRYPQPAPDAQSSEVQLPTAPLSTWSIAGLGQKFGADMQTKQGRQEWKERAALAPMMLQHGADMGLSDEIEGMRGQGKAPMLLPERLATGIEGLIRERTGKAGAAYNAFAGEQNAKIDAAREKHPITSAAMEMAGGSMMTAPSLGMGKTIVGQAARTAIPSAATGGIYAYNDAPEGERVKAGLIGTAISAGAGAVLGGASGAVSKIEPSVGRVFDTERFGKITAAEEKRLFGLLDRAGFSANDVRTALSSFENSVQGLPDLAMLPSRLKDVLVDQLGPGAQKVVDDFLTGAANRSGTQGATTIASGVAEDKVRLGQFANDSAESRFGSASRFDTSEAADQEMARLGKEGYERVFSQPATGDLTELGETLQFYAGSNLNKPLQQIAAGNMQSVEQMVAKDPRRAAHWMQSTAHQLADQADQAGNAPLANAYRSMRDNILKRLEPAAPGYKEVRQQFGTEFTNQRALTAGDRFLSIAEDDMKLGQFLKQMEAMAPDERAAAMLSIRDTLQKNMNRHTEGGLPRTAIVAREPVLNALERLGPEGTAFANDLRMVMQRAKRTTDIDARAGSKTAKTMDTQKFVDDVVANPISRRIGKAMETIGGDAVISGMSGFINPVLTGRVAIRAMGNAFANGRQRKADSLTDLLMRDAGAAPRPPMSGDTPPTVTGGGQAAPRNTLATPDQNVMPQSNRVNAFAASDSGHIATEAASGLAGGAGGFAFAPDVNRDGEVGIVERLGGAGVGAFGGAKLGGAYKRGLDASKARTVADTFDFGMPSRGASDRVADARAVSKLKPLDEETAGKLREEAVHMMLMERRKNPNIDMPTRISEIERELAESMGFQPPAALVPDNTGKMLTDREALALAAADDPDAGVRVAAGRAVDDLDDDIPPTKSSGFGGGKPKIQKDIPLGTPKKAGPSRMDGNTIAKGYDDASGMGAARAVGDPRIVRNQARTEASEMLKKGSLPKDVHKRTGLMPIEYNGRTTMIEAPDMSPDEVLTKVYAAIADPSKASPQLRPILEELGVLQEPLNLGTKRAPQMLGGRSTPMIKDKPANVFARGK